MNNFEEIEYERRYRYANDLTKSRNLNSEKMGQVFQWDNLNKNIMFNRFSRNQSVSNMADIKKKKINEYEAKFQDFNNEQEMRNFLLKNEIERQSNFKNKYLKSNYLKISSNNPEEEIYDDSINKSQNKDKKTEIQDCFTKSIVIKKTQKKAKKRVKSKKKKTSSVTKNKLEKQRNRRQSVRIKKFKEQTRWLSNTGFQKYFGKPAFENYGRGNTNPVWGGPMYGNYLKTHNINPQRGTNDPKYEQVFYSTQLASKKINYNKNNIPRKCQDEYAMAQKDVEKLKNQRVFVMKNKKVEKLGKMNVPNLRKTKRFSSYQNFEEEEKLIKKKLNKKFKGKKYIKFSKKKKNKKFNEYMENAEYDDLEEDLSVEKTNKENYEGIYDKEEFTNFKVDKVEFKNYKDIPAKVSSTNFYRNQDKKKIFEWNPKNYVNMNPKLLNSIPFAGVNQRELNKKSRFIIN